MSVDQVLLYKSCRAIITGICPPELAKRTLGPVFHARWITLALRINFLYMSVASPSEELFRLAFFVINVYALLWFTAKKNWRATEAPGIAFKAMQLLNGLPVNEQRILWPVYKRGFMYWAHSEQLLLAGLASEDRDIRSQAVARILRIRDQQQQHTPAKKRKNSGTVRTFELPAPVLNAQSYWSMIDWTKEQVLEPPYLRKYTDEEVKAFEDSPLILNVPSNSQHVERLIKLITENGKHAASSTLRDGLAKATMKSRQQRPKLRTRADFMK